MKSNDRKEILDELEGLGLVNLFTKRNLKLTFNQFIKSESDNEIELLKEVIRIKKKKENGLKLTFLEASFFDYFLLNY